MILQLKVTVRREGGPPAEVGDTVPRRAWRKREPEVAGSLKGLEREERRA
jgi:hypothetical protein